MNCYAERWVRSAPGECTDRILIHGERHLQSVLNEYAAAIGIARTNPASNDHPTTTTTKSPFRSPAGQRRKAVGGVINEYYQAA